MFIPETLWLQNSFHQDTPERKGFAGPKHPPEGSSPCHTWAARDYIYKLLNKHVTHPLKYRIIYVINHILKPIYTYIYIYICTCVSLLVYVYMCVFSLQNPYLEQITVCCYP